MNGLLCMIGIHKWKRDEYKVRYCVRCNKSNNRDIDKWFANGCKLEAI